jgi:hypothetical protein
VGSLDHFLPRKCRDCLERGVRRFNVANANRQSQQAARNPSDFKSAPGLENRSEQADAADPAHTSWKSLEIDASGVIREKYFEAKFTDRFTANNVFERLFPEPGKI